MKTTCANCGDPLNLPSHAIGERHKLRYCVGCYAAWKRFSINRLTGEQQWAEPLGLYQRRPYDSSLNKAKAE